MSQPIDLENLRAITGGDSELETELFKVFLESAGECLDALGRAQDSNDTGLWASQAHALKGLSFNLGAGPLGQLAKKAQEESAATAGDKALMLRAMQDEFARVAELLRAFLQKAA